MIYLASPYTHPDPEVREARFKAVEAMTGTLLCSGKHVYSPIVHTHEIAKQYELPYNFEFWKNYNFSMIRRCDYLYILAIDGWRQSRGVESEAWFASVCNLKTFLIDERGATIGYNH